MDREGAEKQALRCVNIHRLDEGRRGGKGDWERAAGEVTVCGSAQREVFQGGSWQNVPDAAKKLR